MVCRNCNRVLPDDTSYCLYCGASTVEDLPATMPVGVPRPEATEEAPYGATAPVVDMPPVVFPETEPVKPIATAPVNMGGVPVMETVPVQPPVMQVDYPVPPRKPENPVSAGGAAGILELAKKFGLALAAVLLVVVVVLLVSNSNLKKELAEAQDLQSGAVQNYKNQIRDLETTLQQKEQTIAELQDIADEMKLDADTYNNMVKAMTEHEIGVGSFNFQVSDRFVVAKKGYTGTKVTLTAHWSKEDNAKVYVEHSSDCAKLSFDKETWNKTITMTVLPQEVGFTVATFTNSVDDTSFSVLILVVE